MMSLLGSGIERAGMEFGFGSLLADGFELGEACFAGEDDWLGCLAFGVGCLVS